MAWELIFLSKPLLSAFVKEQKMLLHKSDTGQRKNPHFTAIGRDTYSAHYCKESHTVFSLLKLQQTPLFLFLLLFPCNSGAAITCAFTRYWWWDEGQYAAGGSILSPGAKPRLRAACRGSQWLGALRVEQRGTAQAANSLHNSTQFWVGCETRSSVPRRVQPFPEFGDVL